MAALTQTYAWKRRLVDDEEDDNSEKYNNFELLDQDTEVYNEVLVDLSFYEDVTFLSDKCSITLVTRMGLDIPFDVVLILTITSQDSFCQSDPATQVPLHYQLLYKTVALIQSKISYES
ncbi:Hypothetical predicted protein [Octopus vulgaris]|uniref:Uncharacterized protein n=1 Tax=Octopus vulgaris TaxID=6645 RepID=A0AA36ANP2_OCTVU|nr:Hypothetical predicted protein [Octopus vulgaris]